MVLFNTKRACLLFSFHPLLFIKIIMFVYCLESSLFILFIFFNVFFWFVAS